MKKKSKTRDLRQSNKDIVYESLQLDAIRAVLLNDREYFCRKVCRWYSTNFHTPLHDVYKLEWTFVLQQYYEKTLENLDYNDVYDLAVKDYVPEFADQEEKENREFAQSLIKEQKATLAKKEAKKQKQVPISESKASKKPEVKTMNLNFDDEG